MTDSAARGDDEPSAAADEKPRRRGRPRSGDGPSESRARVLGVARRLFADYGFEATSIRQIATELNVVTASLYHHFSTKEEMLHEILRTAVVQHAEGAPAIAARPVDAERRLVALVVLRIRTWLTDWEAHSIAANEGRFFRQREDFGYVQRAKAQGYHAAETVLRDGIAEGLFRADLDIHLAIQMIWTFLTSAATVVRVPDGLTVPRPARSLDAVFRFHVDAVLRVVRVPARIDAPVPEEELRALAEAV